MFDSSSPDRALAAVVAAGVDGLDADQCLNAIHDLERVSAVVEAWKARLYTRFAEVRVKEGPLAEFPAEEIALELGITSNAAGNRLYLAESLVERLPGTLAALERGEIDLYKARVLEELTHPLSPEAARAVEEKVLARAPEQTAPQLRQAVRRAVLRVDPDGARARHEQRTAERKVVEYPVEDGMAEVTATVTAPEATAIYQRLDTLARMCSDDRTMDQRRADVFVDLLLGKACYDTSATAATVLVTVAATTLAGADDKPGELAGYGPISAAMARELAADGTWRRLLTDPATGALLEYGRKTYRPPAALADFVRARDKTCRFPGCRKPAKQCDIDHLVPFPNGPTDAANLGTICRRHHRLKHTAGWTVVRDTDGTFRWRSPTGREYETKPEPYDDD
ncbi:MAG TPA: DUF222 domain-containing protein [Mycobacteriales bacterium]|nr:DUF222 domain-containing protein [Mycobacteriales bacterium]